MRETTRSCLNNLGLYPGTSSRTQFSAGPHSPVINEYRSMLKVCACRSFLKLLKPATSALLHVALSLLVAHLVALLVGSE